MAFREIQSLDAEKAVRLGDSDDALESIEGYYLGYKEIPNSLNPGKMSRLHIFTVEGKNVGVWGSSIMDRKLASVPAPSNPNNQSKVAYMTAVAFTGLKPATKKGYRPSKNFSVGFDDTNSVAIDTALEAGLSNGDDDIDANDFIEEAAPTPLPLTPARTAIKTGTLTKEHAKSVTSLLRGK